MTEPKGKAQGEGKMQGEGDYKAGRRFQEAERSFVEKGPVEEKARDAEEALKGPEGAGLEAARRRSAAGDPRHEEDSSDPHTEENLDHGLDETFPASDPVSISPGSD
jgi:hypothetical protein